MQPLFAHNLLDVYVLVVSFLIWRVMEVSVDISKFKRLREGARRQDNVLIIIGCALVGLSYRMHVEECVLQEHLGQRYLEYMQRTKRLIPFVF